MKYRKKPVVVEAFQMTLERSVDNSEWPDWLNRAWQLDSGAPGSLYSSNWDDYNAQLMIGTMEGTHLVSWGDYIIQGVAGEIYPCKPDIFEKTYEPVTDEDGEMTDNKSLREQVAAAIAEAAGNDTSPTVFDSCADAAELEDVKQDWNAQADEHNQWCDLSGEEMVEFALELMDKRRCGSCKWWDDSPWDTDPETRLCLHPDGVKPEQYGFVENAGPMFGCIRWGAKDGQ